MIALAITFLRRFLPFLREGKNLYDAIRLAGFEKRWRCLKQLQLPDRTNNFQLSNPVVTSVLHQVRKVISALIRDIGKPERIVIETTRELKANSEKRADIIKTQKQNQNIRKQCEERIREYHGYDASVLISLTDITKYRLWEEQNHYCPYSNHKIPVQALFSRNTEIDHILPYSMSLDNTLNNKVVCFAKENQNKAQRTPIDWLGEGSTRFEQISTAIANARFGDNEYKWERFCVRGDEIAEKYTPERLLRDTSYIARAVRDYLKRLYPYSKAESCVGTTKGAITAELRHIWQLDPILRDGEEGPKKRDDLRHHAVDAAVIAVTSPKRIQKITKVLQRNWPKRPFQVPDIRQLWKGFDRDLANTISQVIVSHRVQRKVKGPLHKETIYHKVVNGRLTGKYVTRKPLNKSFSPAMAETICDEHIKELVINRFQTSNGNAEKAFETPVQLKNKNGNPIQIKSVRVYENLSTVIPIRSEYYVKPGKNHHVEFFCINNNGHEEIICKVWDMFNCANRVRKAEPIILRKHPDPKYESSDFLVSLAEGETVIFEDKLGNKNLVRILSFSGNPDNPKQIEMELLPINIAGLSKLDAVEGNALRRLWRVQSLNDKKTGFITRFVQKVTIDPLGRVRRAND